MKKGECQKDMIEFKRKGKKEKKIKTNGKPRNHVKKIKTKRKGKKCKSFHERFILRLAKISRCFFQSFIDLGSHTYTHTHTHVPARAHLLRPILDSVQNRLTKSSFVHEVWASLLFRYANNGQLNDHLKRFTVSIV